MSTRKLLALTGIFLALLGFVVMFERHQPTSEEKEKARKKLVDFRPEEVTALVIERTDLPKVDLKKGESGRWSVGTEPAEGSVVEGLLADLNRLDVVGKIRTDFDAKELGLDSPRARALVTLKGGRKIDILFGLAVPGGDATAAAEAGRFGAVRFAPVASLVKPLDDFRSRALVDMLPGEITRVTVSKGTARVVAARTRISDGAPSGEWHLEEPVKDLAARAFLDQLLADLAGTRVTDFPQLSASDWTRVGLSPPQAVVVLEKGRETVARLGLGSAKAGAAGQFYALRDRTVVVVDDRVGEALGKELTAWREPKACPLDVFALTRLSFESGPLRVGAERVEGEWLSAGRTVTAAAVAELADRVASLDVRSFVARKDAPRWGVAIGKGAPLARGEFRLERRIEPVTVSFWPASPLDGTPMVGVEASGRSDLMLVDRAAFESVRAAAEKLRLGAPGPPPPKRR